MAAMDFPGSPSPGDVFTDPSGASYNWNGYAWMGGAANSMGALIVSDTPPSAPANNSLWFESDTGMLFLRYNDGNSSQWVQVNALPNGAGYMPLQGVTDGSNAPAGQIGEVITANPGSAVQLTSTVWTNIVSITLTAGDWDVWGAIQQNTTVASVIMQAAISRTSGAPPASIPSAGTIASMSGPNFTSCLQAAPMARVNVAASTPVYLLAYQNFASGTANAATSSFIMARRAR